MAKKQGFGDLEEWGLFCFLERDVVLLKDLVELLSSEDLTRLAAIEAPTGESLVNLVVRLERWCRKHYLNADHIAVVKALEVYTPLEIIKDILVAASNGELPDEIDLETYFRYFPDERPEETPAV